MAKKILALLCLVGILGVVGCRHELKDVWSFDHIETYFNTFDDDLYELHQDIDYILVGVDNYTDYLNEVDW